MKNCFRVLFSSLALISITACVNTGCDDEFLAYRGVKAQAPIEVPADLEQPDNESLAPAVNPADANKLKKNSAGECLDKPPKI